MSVIPLKPHLPPGKYRHYKGGKYEVIGVACDEATLSWIVLYRPLYENDGPDLWARSYAVFIEEVEINGVRQARFERIDKADN